MSIGENNNNNKNKNDYCQDIFLTTLKYFPIVFQNNLTSFCEYHSNFPAPEVKPKYRPSCLQRSQILWWFTLVLLEYISSIIKTEFQIWLISISSLIQGVWNHVYAETNNLHRHRRDVRVNLLFLPFVIKHLPSTNFMIQNRWPILIYNVHFMAVMQSNNYVAYFRKGYFKNPFLPGTDLTWL